MVGMAQDFAPRLHLFSTGGASCLCCFVTRSRHFWQKNNTKVGSNNINLFVPSGQFGTRLQGGKDGDADAVSCCHLLPGQSRISVAAVHRIMQAQDTSTPDWSGALGKSIKATGSIPVGG